MSRPFTPTDPDELKKLDFCNAFWNAGGVETLLDKMRVGGKTLGDLAKWYSERWVGFILFLFLSLLLFFYART